MGQVVGTALESVGGNVQFLYAPILVAAAAAVNFFDLVARRRRQNLRALNIPPAAVLVVNFPALGVEAQGDVRAYF